MSSLITSRRKLLSKRKRSFLNNKIFFCTHCVAFGITNYESVKNSSHYCGYIAVGCLCDREVTEHHFQIINYKRKRIKTEILKTYKEYL